MTMADTIVFFTLVLLIHLASMDAFSIHSTTTTSSTKPLSTSLIFSEQRVSKLFASVNPEAEDDDDLEPDYARVRRRRGGGRYYDEEEEQYDREKANKRVERDEYYGDGNDDDREYYDMNDDEDYGDEEDDDGDMDYEEEEYSLFGDAIIPNPLLDSMDPDGAAERFPELAKDPRFWFDMLLFIMFLDFLSAVGPQAPFTDPIW